MNEQNIIKREWKMNNNKIYKRNKNIFCSFVIFFYLIFFIFKYSQFICYFRFLLELNQDEDGENIIFCCFSFKKIKGMRQWIEGVRTPQFYIIYFDEFSISFFFLFCLENTILLYFINILQQCESIWKEIIRIKIYRRLNCVCVC